MSPRVARLTVWSGRSTEQEISLNASSFELPRIGSSYRTLAKLSGCTTVLLSAGVSLFWVSLKSEAKLFLDSVEVAVVLSCHGISRRSRSRKTTGSSGSRAATAAAATFLPTMERMLNTHKSKNPYAPWF